MNWHVPRIMCLLLVGGLHACGAAGSVPNLHSDSGGGQSALGRVSLHDSRPAATAQVVPAAGMLHAILINAGGAADGVWQPDHGYDGGSTMNAWDAKIDTSRVVNPAPQAVYQTQRYAGTLTYTISNLAANATLTVRLQFVESWFTGPGKRVFNVAINGSRVLTNFDIFAAAGGTNIALAKSFTSTADAAGRLTIRMAASLNNASIAAIEIIPAAATSPTPAPAPTSVASPTPAPIATSLPAGPKVLSGTVTSSLPTWNAWLGHSTALVGVYNDSGAAAWSSLDDINWMISTYPAKTPMVWSLATYPMSSSLAAVASGAGNAYYAKWAAEILTAAAPAPDGNYYVRPNWEAPAAWFSWGSGCGASPSNCIAAYRQIASVFHAASPKFKLVWDVIPVYGVSTDNAIYYPGDAYVDVMSQDLYLDTSGNNSVAGQWSYGLKRANGLNWLASFAAAHGKRVAMTEWGVNSNTAGPLITDIQNWLSSHNAAYALYFDMGNTQLSNNQYPAAGAAAKPYF